MGRRHLIVIAAVIAAMAPIGARADVPHPDPNFAGTVIPKPCDTTLAPDNSGTYNTYEQKQLSDEGWPHVQTPVGDDVVRYPGTYEVAPGVQAPICQRLEFRFGPITVKPGQNDVLVQPVTIDKPAYDGYLVRFSPNLVEADPADPSKLGGVPPIEKIHLHHGTWITLTDYTGGLNDYTPAQLRDIYDGRTYGSGPFFASGEEKTIADFPAGFGMPVKRTDAWQLLYMVHNLQPTSDLVYITYDIDFIPKAAAESASFMDQFNIGQAGPMKPVYPVWLDVDRGSAYPVFNVQRGFGGSGTCTWPLQNCARFDPYGGHSIPNQGPGSTAVGSLADEISKNLPNIWTVPAGKMGRMNPFVGGTLIGIGGHLHPGGLADTISIIRGKKTDGSWNEKPVFVSDAKYWNWANHTDTNGPATSWDLSMTVTGLPRWALHIQPGDMIRIEGVYDSSIQSTYENMGIVVAYITPDNPTTGTWAVPNAIDAFNTDTYPGGVDSSEGCVSGGVSAPLATRTLCLNGIITHGHMAEADNHSGPFGSLQGAPPTYTNQVAIANFSYQPGGFDQIQTTGIPTVPLGQPITFTNVDAAADIYHTVTSCAYPCKGPTGIAFPIADGTGDQGSAVDFDSAELGYDQNVLSHAFGQNSTITFGPAKNEVSWSVTLNASEAKSGELFTYFCRIHPDMRGVFAVQ